MVEIQEGNVRGVCFRYGQVRSQVGLMDTVRTTVLGSFQCVSFVHVSEHELEPSPGKHGIINFEAV